MSDILNDEKWLCEMRDKMKPDEYIFPLGIRMGKSFYKVGEISNPEIFKDSSVTPSNFRVIFGSIYNMFRNTSFPIKQISNYTILKKIESLDPKTQVNTVFFIFESDYIYKDDLNQFEESINEYYDLLFDYTKSFTEKNREELIDFFIQVNEF